MKYVYTGPSWANSSYPVQPSTPITSLAKEWKIPFINTSKPGSSVLDRIAYIKTLKLNLPIIWIYNEPTLDLKDLLGVSYAEFLTRKDWLDLWHECNQKCLKEISSLGVPVLLIGGHSDITDCDYSNITVGHKSWQKYLAELAGMPVTNGVVQVDMDDGGNFSVDFCWGSEVIHKFMHQHPEISPDSELVNSMWNMYFFWGQLEKANLFYQVHPNFQGNKKFAEFLKPTVEKFIEENQ